MGKPPGWEDEHTDLIPRVVLVQRQRAAMLMLAAAAAFVMGVATLIVPKNHRVEQSTIDAIKAKAVQLGVVFDEAFKKTRDRAEGFAGTPVLEAGILTDAATVLDIVNTEIRLKTRAHENLELFQLRGDQVTTLARVPPKSKPVAWVKDQRARLETRDGVLSVVVSAPIAPVYATPELSGELALAAPVELSALALSADMVEAKLTVNGKDLMLVGKASTMPTGGARLVTAPVVVDPAWKLGEITLAATPAQTAYHASWVLPVRYGALGLAGVLVSIALVMFARARRR